jgi:hypothetical protein
MELWAGESGKGRDLLHQQHLTGAFDRPIQLPLVMGRQAGVLARQDTALIRDELLEQIHVLEIQGIHREIDLWLWARGSDFCA